MSFFTLIGFQHHPFTAEDLVRATNVKNPYTKIGARVLSNCFNICLAPKQNLFKEGAEGGLCRQERICLCSCLQAHKVITFSFL